MPSPFLLLVLPIYDIQTIYKYIKSLSFGVSKFFQFGYFFSLPTWNRLPAEHFFYSISCLYKIYKSA